MHSECIVVELDASTGPLLSTQEHAHKGQRLGYAPQARQYACSPVQKLVRGCTLLKGQGISLLFIQCTEPEGMLTWLEDYPGREGTCPHSWPAPSCLSRVPAVPSSMSLLASRQRATYRGLPLPDLRIVFAHAIMRLG